MRTVPSFIKLAASKQSIALAAVGNVGDGVEDTCHVPHQCGHELVSNVGDGAEDMRPVNVDMGQLVSAVLGHALCCCISIP